MATETIILGVKDPESGRRTEYSTYLHFTVTQVIDRLLDEFGKEGTVPDFSLYLRRTSTLLPPDQTLRDAGIRNGDFVELRKVRAARLEQAGDSVAEADSPSRRDSRDPRKKERWIRLRSIGRGGQGDIFLVKDSVGEYQELLVQKRLGNIFRKDRFEREVRAVQALSHPNIVRYIDHDTESKRPYLVTEYCAGGPLGKADLSQFSLVDHLHLFADICRGVAHAHAQEKPIIHRDLKPANIFLREGGTPVVGDWGLCFVDEDGRRLTEINEKVGPRDFIAPELADGFAEDVTPQADVYSLGKILYWLIAGRIFAREDHRAPRFDLTQDRKDGAIFFIYDLFDKTIVREPEARLSDAGVLLREVEEITRRILMKAHPIDLAAPQECTYCGTGIYKKVVDYNYPRGSAGEVSDFGFSPVAGSIWLILICDHCGNVQVFRPDKSKNPRIWEAE
jgi:hypothetical protein